jgi:hypothetical protein
MLSSFCARRAPGVVWYSHSSRPVPRSRLQGPHPPLRCRCRDNLIVFVDFTVQLLSPVFFGSFAIGRLRDIRKSRMRVVYDLVLMPSGLEISAGILALLLARGTIGKTYLLLKHPCNVLVALPLIDDDPAFLAYILGFASGDRRDEIVRQLAILRSQSP